MAHVSRTLLVGLAAACAALGPVATTVASADSPNVIGGNGTWIDTLIPSADEVELLHSDDDFEFVNGGVLVSEPPAVPRILPGPDDTRSSGAESSFVDNGESLSEAQAFRLHSNPGADKVIFLDFDGATIQGTAWNSSPTSTIELGEYSREIVGQEIDGFSQLEIDGIVEIWQRVSEDYAPWPVDVTTEQPADEALYSINRSVDTRYGSRVVISHDSAWYGQSGGVAYVGTSGQRYYSPAFVFSNNLPEYAAATFGGAPNLVAEAASHEVGHNLGLSHDGVLDSDPNDSINDGSPYYGGHENGDWAPIMGVGYHTSTTHWSRGDYPNANQTQDDIAIIDGHLIGRSTGPTTASSTLGPGDMSIIGTLSDGGAVDAYPLVVSDGPLSVELSKVDPAGNLLAALVVTNNDTGESSTVTPDDAVTWSHRVDDLDTGSYTIEVRSIGWDDPNVVGDEFTSYGSMGRYVVTIDAPASVPTVTTTTTTVPGSITTIPPLPTTTVAGDTTTTTTTTPSTPSTPSNDLDEADANRLTAIDPTRLLDTRSLGAESDRLAAGQNVRIQVAGAAGIATDTRAAVINVVAVQPTANGYLSVTPCTDVAVDDRTSSLNYVGGSNIANSTIATLSTDGSICIYSSASTDVVLDVTGAIGPSGTAGLTNTSVRRIADSRTGEGIPRRLDRGETAVIGLGGMLQGDTTAISINVTAVASASTGFLSIDNCAGGAATAALNFSAGENRGNNGVFALSSDQSLCVSASTAVDIIIDLTGEFGDDGFTYLPADPVRLLDTRATGALTAGTSTSFVVPALADGSEPIAASINIASAGHPRNGFITSWNCGALSTSSALNPVAGQVTANGALAALNQVGRSCLFHEAGGDLVVDLNGWWV